MHFVILPPFLILQSRQSAKNKDCSNKYCGVRQIENGEIFEWPKFKVNEIDNVALIPQAVD